VDEKDLKEFTKSLIKNQEYSRAAAVSVFCLEIRLALQILEAAPIGMYQKFTFAFI
jgi:hypothetical protein